MQPKIKVFEKSIEPIKQTWDLIASDFERIGAFAHLQRRCP